MRGVVTVLLALVFKCYATRKKIEEGGGEDNYELEITNYE